MARMLEFIVIDCPTAYNVILGRHALIVFEAIIFVRHRYEVPFTHWNLHNKRGSAWYQAMLYVSMNRRSQLGKQAMVIIEENEEPRAMVVVEGAQEPQMKEDEVAQREEIDPRIGVDRFELQALEMLDESKLDHAYPEFVEKNTCQVAKEKVVGKGKMRSSGRRGSSPPKMQIISEAKYPTWIANPVLVSNPSRKWGACIVFSGLNKACPKEYFPLPRVDQLVDATTSQ
ncbi:uncharacterized protein LOC133785420 [Humulus lupulus]|uniref:uncharacterized protein LOC133785420 n=1 Tax=Humulus lupulus TaxID=3486 RepID=UPI002B4106C3|nr:uncharacterized protein LOC133785420 [Humulus lupulus]